MSELSTVSVSESSPAGHPHDLLAHLYREIGISAVAAALEIVAKPEAPEKEPAKSEEPLPAVLRDTLAA